MDSNELRRVLRQRFKIYDVKVLAKDELEIYSKTPGIYLVNTNSSSTPNTIGHWVVFSNTGGHKSNCEFFDSLGQTPLYYGFDIGRNCDSVSKQIQSNTSTLCGEYALYYIVCHSHGFDIKYICDSFSNDLYFNDYNIISRLTKLSVE